MYGITEVTVHTTFKELDINKDFDGVLSNIGGPIPTTQTYVIDDNNNLCPIGVEGEIAVSGEGIARGYLNRQDLTNEVFIDNPFAHGDYDKILYKSGDYGRFLPNGDLEYISRMDDQVKIRGFRIELGEIESALRNIDSIDDAVCIAIDENDGSKALSAYFVSDEEFDILSIKELLSGELPGYMVPSFITQIDEIPLTINGKLDKKALPDPALISEYVAPTNDVEAFFADVFAEILDLDKVGVNDNFFDIGGNSLLVAKITMAALNRNYNINYFGDVFENPTPRKLANYVLSNDSLKELNEDVDYDYTSINNLLKKNNLKTFLDGEMEESLGNILLTGATGFLGIHVLKELIDNETGNIYCLVRSNADSTSEERLKSTLLHYFGNSYDDLFNERIQVFDGDITNFNDFEKLASYDINTLINCAANVKHFSSGTDIEDINYGGVLNGLKFAKLKKCKFVQVSTVSVSGESVDNFPPADSIFNENDLYIGQKINNKYVNSKFLAERAILESAVTDDLNVKILRVGNLMPRSYDSKFQINFDTNAFLNRIKALTAIGKIPYPNLIDKVELSYIDITAKSIVLLAKTPKDCTIFHPFNNNIVSIVNFISIIGELVTNITPVSREEFESDVNEILNDEDRRDSILGFITYGYSYDNTRVSIPVEHNYTIEVLYSLGLHWPSISESYIYNFIKNLNEMDYFDV